MLKVTFNSCVPYKRPPEFQLPALGSGLVTALWLQHPQPTSPKLCSSHSITSPETPRFPRCVFTAGVLRNLGPALVRGGGTGAQPWSDRPPPRPRDPQLLWDPSFGPWALLP